jgi:hypothetical protein
MNMKRIIAIVLLLLTGELANAAPVFLSCSGKESSFVNGRDTPQKPALYSIAVDLATNKLTLNEKELAISNVSDSAIWAGFTHPDKRSALLRLNRITGSVLLSIVSPAAAMTTSFEGVCKAGQKQF